MQMYHPDPNSFLTDVNIYVRLAGDRISCFFGARHGSVISSKRRISVKMSSGIVRYESTLHNDLYSVFLSSSYEQINQYVVDLEKRSEEMGTKRSKEKVEEVQIQSMCLPVYHHVVNNDAVLPAVGAVRVVSCRPIPPHQHYSICGAQGCWVAPP